MLFDPRQIIGKSDLDFRCPKIGTVGYFANNISDFYIAVKLGHHYPHLKKLTKIDKDSDYPFSYDTNGFKYFLIDTD